jgi:hypothetical protein
MALAGFVVGASAPPSPFHGAKAPTTNEGQPRRDFAFSARGFSLASTSPDPRFGLVEAFWDTQAAAESGAGWERVLFLWSAIQPGGPEDWNGFQVPDEPLNAARAAGREVVGVLKSTPAWATDGAPVSGVPRGLYLPLDDPGNLWADFVRKVVAYYAPKGVHRWVIWNEPEIDPGVTGHEWDGDVYDYAKLLEVAYRAAKATDPQAVIHLAGMSYWHDATQGRTQFLERLLTALDRDPLAVQSGYYFDVASLHIYFTSDSVFTIVSTFRDILKRHGLDKPVWINETNAAPDRDPAWPVDRPNFHVTPEQQSAFLLQAFALGLAAGAERIAVYKLIDTTLPPGGEDFGLIRPDGSRRPAFAAFQAITRYYTGTQAALLDQSPAVTQVTLDQGERTTRVLWARTAGRVFVRLPAFASAALLVDQTGASETLQAERGAYTLMLPGANCDPIDGCMIGGPTFLLIEEAPLVQAASPEIVPLRQLILEQVTSPPFLIAAFLVLVAALIGLIYLRQRRRRP